MSAAFVHATFCIPCTPNNKRVCNEKCSDNAFRDKSLSLTSYQVT